MAMVPRIITAFGIELRRADGTALKGARPVNLSENGLCIRTDSALKPDEIVEVGITLEEDQHLIDTRARVVWVRKDSQFEVYYCGLGFIELADGHRERVRQYVHDGAAWLVQFLSEFPLFGALSVEDCRNLLPIITLRDLERHEILYRADEHTADLRGLFIVHSGLLNIFKSVRPDPKRQLAVVSAGQIFGETTLVSDAPHSATVMAVNPSRLIQIGKAGYMTLRKAHPQLCLKLMEIVAGTLAARLGRTTKKLFSPVRPTDLS